MRTAGDERGGDLGDHPGIAVVAIDRQRRSALGQEQMTIAQILAEWIGVGPGIGRHLGRILTPWAIGGGSIDRLTAAAFAVQPFADRAARKAEVLANATERDAFSAQCLGACPEDSRMHASILERLYDNRAGSGIRTRTLFRAIGFEPIVAAVTPSRRTCHTVPD
jgi:hypothetical protein